LRGTSGDDGTISWPLSAKNLRKVDLISLTPLMGSNREFVRELGENAFRQGGQPCPETVQLRQRLEANAYDLTLIAARACVDRLG
jgi:hypothetical protein